MTLNKAATWLRKTLDYEFRDDALLERALTHRSAPGANNERLEYLGDSILGFYIIKFDLPVAVKYLAIVFLSLISSVLLYEIGVRRFNFVRFFFGLKKRV